MAKTSKKFPFVISSQEEGRGPRNWHEFSTLKGAQDFIKSYWQGREYKDGPDEFHTDYSTFRVFGFTLDDVGKSRFVDEDPYGSWFEWDWIDLDAPPEPEPEPEKILPATMPWRPAYWTGEPQEHPADPPASDIPF